MLTLRGSLFWRCVSQQHVRKRPHANTYPHVPSVHTTHTYTYADAFVLFTDAHTL